MEKTTKVVLNAVKKFNETASKEEKKLFAMYLVYNITMDACDNHWEASGLLGSVVTEMHNEFSKGGGIQVFEKPTLN